MSHDPLRKLAMRAPAGELLVGVAFGDQDDEETAGMVRLDVMDVSILLGPRNAIAVARAIMEVAGAQIAAMGAKSLELH